MKRIISILISFILFTNFLSAQTTKRTVAVLNFVNAGGVDNNEISILTDRFNSSLFNANVYKVLEREKMNEVLKAQDFNASDNCNSTECAVQVGQLLGVEIMVAGKVGKFGQTYTIDVRMIDVSTGELLKTSSENYKGEKDGMLGVIAAMASSLANKADISAEALEQELVKLREQNKKLEEGKNQKAQEENAKKQEELKAQLASIEQNKKLEQLQKTKTEAEKQKAAEEQKRKQELFARIEAEKKKQAVVANEGMSYQDAAKRIGELQESINAVEQEIESQKQKAVSLVGDDSPRGEFETQQEYNTRLYNNKQQRKQVSDEYETLKTASKKVYADELASLMSKRYTVGKERLTFKLGTYNVEEGFFPVTVMEAQESDPCDKNPVNSKVYAVREDAKKLRDNESLLDLKATLLVSADQKLLIDKITLVDAENNKNYEFAVNMSLGGTKKTYVGSFTDPRDGKTYRTVKIGNQVWMAENLNYAAGEGTYCYDNKTSNCNQYGKLYTWEAAKQAVPKGWHLPTKDEFDQLLSYLGGAGEKAYSELTKTDDCSFHVLFGGLSGDYSYKGLGSVASFWSSSEDYADSAWFLYVFRGGETYLNGFYKYGRLSVRCVKD